MEIEFRETENNVGDIIGLGGICFKRDYTITAEARVRGMEGDIRKQYQKLCTRWITDAIVKFAMDYIREEANENTDGIPVYVTNLIKNKMVLLHPRDHHEMIANELPRKLAIYHELGIMAWEKDKDCVSFTHMLINKDLVNEVLQAVSDYMANTFTMGRNLKIIMPLEGLVKYGENQEELRSALQGLVGRKLFEFVGYDIYISDKVDQPVVIDIE